MVPINNIEHQKLQISTALRGRSLTKRARSVDPVKSISLQDPQDTEFFARKVAAACFSSCSFTETLHPPGMPPRIQVSEDVQEDNKQRNKIPFVRKDSGCTMENLKKAQNLDVTYRPYSWEDHKRKLFLEWLDGQPDAHDDVWGFSSSSCTPVCLSRSTSVVHITSEAGDKEESR